MLVAVLLLVLAVFWPLRSWSKSRESGVEWKSGGIIYFLSIGLGFMLAEMAMIEQQSWLLGHPIYLLAVVLSGLILSTAVGSLVSERVRTPGWQTCQGLTLGAAAVVVAYAFAVLPLIHAAAGLDLWEKIALALGMLFPCGVLMGFCFPLGMRTLRTARSESTLPWDVGIERRNLRYGCISGCAPFHGDKHDRLRPGRRGMLRDCSPIASTLVNRKQNERE